MVTNLNVSPPNFTSGAGCSKLMTSLVNISLNFQRRYYKYDVIFTTKNYSIFDDIVGIYLPS